MSQIRTISLIIISAVLIFFAVGNRTPVEIELWPFLNEPLSFPVFVVFFIGILVGVALSAVVVAIRGVKHYTEIRSARKEKEKLSTNVENLERELDVKPPKVEQKDYTEDGPGLSKKLEKK
ncbi:MAG: LapA family protein [Sphingomonadales bacterium]